MGVLRPVVDPLHYAYVKYSAAMMDGVIPLCETDYSVILTYLSIFDLFDHICLIVLLPYYTLTETYLTCLGVLYPLCLVYRVIIV